MLDSYQILREGKQVTTLTFSKIMNYQLVLIDDEDVKSFVHSQSYRLKNMCLNGESIARFTKKVNEIKNQRFKNEFLQHLIRHWFPPGISPSSNSTNEEEFICRVVDECCLNIHYELLGYNTCPEGALYLSVTSGLISLTKRLVINGVNVTSFMNSTLSKFPIPENDTINYLNNIILLTGILKNNNVAENEYFEYYSNDECAKLAGLGFGFNTIKLAITRKKSERRYR